MTTLLTHGIPVIHVDPRDLPGYEFKKWVPFTPPRSSLEQLAAEYRRLMRRSPKVS